MKIRICLLIVLLTLSLTAEVIHPKYRKTAYPNEIAPRLNPPQLLWPSQGKNAHYRVELSQDKNFVDEVIKSKTINWACFTSHEVLAEGQWFWRVSLPKTGEVLGTYSFTIDQQIQFPTPKFEQFKANIPVGHPRFLTSSKDLATVKQNLNGHSLYEEIISNSDIFLTQKTKPLKVEIENSSELKAHEIHRISINKAKSYLSRRLMECSYLSCAYIITQNKAYAQRAIENAKAITQLDPQYTNLNDFTQSMCLDALNLVFDNCYDQIDPKTKQVFLKHIKSIAGLYYKHKANNLETTIFNNHAWQKTFNSLLKSALITLGHLPEADKWLEYCYEVWCCRAPAGGFNLDGAWMNGTGYFTANMVTLMQTPSLLSRYTGFNFFAHPWFKNAPKGLMMNWPAKSYSNGFGDGHGSPTNPRWKQAMLIKAIASANQDSEAQWFYEHMLTDQQCNKAHHGKNNSKHALDTEFIEWFATAYNSEAPKSKKPQQLNAAAFPESGFVSSHSNYGHEDNIFVSLRSSPFGSGSHTCSNQNAFNLIAGGEPLFLSSGYYTSFSDRHNLLHYRSTRGHNSILADGLGQSLGVHGTGQIQHFTDNHEYTYICGDASSAYGGGITDPMWIKKMKQAGVEATRENGYGDAGVTKFKRHLLFIKPSTLIIYDDLEAKKPISWTWLLHSPQEMRQSEDFIFTSNHKFKSRLKLLSSIPCDQKITTKFYEPAVNWTKKTIQGKLVEYKDQWHLKAKTAKSTKATFLSVIQISDDSFTEIDIQDTGEVKFDKWSIKAELGNNEVGLKLLKDKEIILKCDSDSAFIKDESKLNFSPLELLPVYPSR